MKRPLLILTGISLLLLMTYSHLTSRAADQIGSTPQLNQTLDYHEVLHIGRGTTSMVAWSPNGQLLGVSGSQGIWLYTSEFHDVKHLDEDVFTLSQIAWNSDGKKIVLSTKRDENLEIQNWETGQILTKLQDSAGVILRVWSPDDKLIAGVKYSTNNTIVIWDATNGNLLFMFTLDAGSVTSMNWSPNSRMLSSTSSNGSVYIWNVTTEKLDKQLMEFVDGAYITAWSPDGKTLAASGAIADKYAVILWDTNSFQVLRTLNPSTGINALAWHPNGQQLVLGSSDGNVYIWSDNLGIQQAAFNNHHTIVNSIAWSPDGTKLVIASDDNTVDIWSTTNNKLLNTLNGYSSPVQWIKWNPNGKNIAVVYETNTNIKILSSSTGNVETVLKPILHGDTPSGILALTWSPNSKLIAGSFETGTSNVWDLSGSADKPLSLNPTGTYSVLSWNRDNRTLLNVARDGDFSEVLLWDALSGKQLNTLQLKTDKEPVVWADWSPDGKYIATFTHAVGAPKYKLQIRNGSTFQTLVTFPGTEADYPPSFFSVWSPNSKQLASCTINYPSKKCSLWIWDISTEKIQKAFERDVESSINSLSWNYDGTLLASDDGESNLLIWQSSNGALVATISHNSSINSLSWNPISNQVATANEDGSVRIWTVSSK